MTEQNTEKPFQKLIEESERVFQLHSVRLTNTSEHHFAADENNTFFSAGFFALPLSELFSEPFTADFVSVEAPPAFETLFSAFASASALDLTPCS